MLGIGSQTKYTEAVRSFALTLHFHSVRAYNYLRQKFNDNLPHTSTIRKWYVNSGTTGEPGLCNESFETLKKLVEKHKANGKQIVCSLIFDEMSIRKHLQWSDSRKEFLGSINYGFRATGEDLPLAKNVIVFMINGINVNFNMPVAFYFIDSLTAIEKANLLREIIIAITTLDVRVLSITFDGLISNITMCNIFGANFDVDNCKPYFILPNDEHKIYIILDPSHMEKLARNCIASTKVLYDAQNSKIEWRFFETLEKFRNERGLTLTHKLNKRHMHHAVVSR